MSRTIILTLALFLMSSGLVSAAPGVEQKLLHKHDGRWYVTGDKEPFSGKAVSRYEDGSLRSETDYRDGLRHGKDQAWYPGGELEYVVRYKKGEIQSLGSSWYSSQKPPPEKPDFVLCSDHPDLGAVCGRADTADSSRFEFCTNNSC